MCIAAQLHQTFDLFVLKIKKKLSVYFFARKKIRILESRIHSPEFGMKFA
jgi:hypothetical protein